MPKSRGDNTRKRSPKDAPRRGGKKKICVFCAEKIDWVDYKDVNLLRRYQSDRGKIRARRVSGNCNQHQHEVAVAIKTARELALLPYTQRTMTESRVGGRAMRGRSAADEAREQRSSAPSDDAAEASTDEATEGTEEGTE